VLHGLCLLKQVCDCSLESAHETRRSRHSTCNSSSSLLRLTHGASSTSWPSRAANHPSSQADHWCKSRRCTLSCVAPPSTKSKHQASQAFEMTFKLGTSLSLAVLHARRNRLIVTIHLSRKFPVLEFWHESLCLHNVGVVGFKSVFLHSFQCDSKHVVSTGLLIWGLDLEFNSHQFNY
jgi:hypothetical protein